MKLVLLLLPLLSFAWTFKASNIDSYTPKQLEVLRQSYLVGYEKNLHLTLMAIAIVETRAGKFDWSNNHICGPHQLDVNYTESTCAAVESNPFLSALEARRNFTWWLNYTKGNWAKAIMHYNAGFKLVPHSKVYLQRIKLVVNELSRLKEYNGI